MSFDYLPEKMINREGQTQRLFSLLRPIVEAGASSNAFLYGPVGTGKTHTAKRFCLDFKKYASESDRAVDWDVVNCRQRMGDDAVLPRLIQHFDAHFPERGFSIAEKMETLRRLLKKHRLHFIVILDEVDALLKKSGANVIYAFARMAEERIGSKGNISMILISQRPNALEYMDRAGLSTFRRSNVVEFPKYDRAELRDIVAGRVQLAMHPGTVGEDLIDLIADIASEFGDARYAIELLEKAGMLADEESLEEVAPEHLRGAKAHVHPTDVQERLGLLDVPKKLVLLAIARKSRKKAYITMGDAEEAYAVVCEEYDKKPELSYRLFEMLLAQKIPSLCITRQYPDRVRRERGLTDVRIIWLSHTPGEDYHNPTAIGTLAKVIQKFIEDNNGEGAVLLDGLEYLIINNGFLQTLMFVEHVNEFVMQRRAIILLPVSPDTLEEKELALLERNMKVLESPALKTDLESREVSRLLDNY